MEEHWPYKTGEEVFVHGKGIGTVVKLEEADNPLNDKIQVRIEHKCCCSICGNIHNDTFTETVHPMHVSYTPTERTRQSKARV